MGSRVTDSWKCDACRKVWFACEDTPWELSSVDGGRPAAHDEPWFKCECGARRPGALPQSTQAVDHPDHYGGADNPYEAIKVIEAWGLGFCLGNTVKYVSRAGKKDPAKHVEDLEKARWYLDHEIRRLRGER